MVEASSANPEVIVWSSELETEPALEVILPQLAELKPGEHFPNNFYITNTPVIRAANNNDKEFHLGDLDTLELAMAEAAQKLGIELPTIGLSVERIPGLKILESGKTAWSQVRGIQCLDKVKEDVFIGEIEKIEESVTAGKAVGFNFAPADIETVSVKYIRDYLSDNGIETSLMKVVIHEVRSADLYSELRIMLTPKVLTGDKISSVLASRISRN